MKKLVSLFSNLFKKPSKPTKRDRLLMKRDLKNMSDDEFDAWVRSCEQNYWHSAMLEDNVCVGEIGNPVVLSSPPKDFDEEDTLVF